MNYPPKSPLPRQFIRRFRGDLYRKEALLELFLLAGFFINLRLLALSSNFIYFSFALVLQVVIYMQVGWLLHDCVHGALYKNSKLNLLVGRVFISLAGIPFHFGKLEHLKHHKHMGLIEGDTELSDFSETEAIKRPLGRLLAVLLQSFPGRMIFYPVSLTSNIYSWCKSGLKETRTLGNLKSLFIDLLFVFTVWGGIVFWASAHHCVLRTLLVGMLSPIFIGMGILSVGTQPIHTLVPAFPLIDLPLRHRAFYTCRSFDGDKFWRLLYANSSYHLEHHLYPGVSRWDLGRFARAIRPDLRLYSVEHGLPMLVHPSVPAWYAEYWKIKKLYNPILDRSSFYKENSTFTLSV